MADKSRNKGTRWPCRSRKSARESLDVKKGTRLWLLKHEKCLLTVSTYGSERKTAIHVRHRSHSCIRKPHFLCRHSNHRKAPGDSLAHFVSRLNSFPVPSTPSTSRRRLPAPNTTQSSDPRLELQRQASSRMQTTRIAGTPSLDRLSAWHTAPEKFSRFWNAGTF